MTAQPAAEPGGAPPTAQAPVTITLPPEPAWLPFLNVSTSWACRIAAMAGSFVVTPALIHGLGESLYGSWLLINSFITQLRTLDLGMSAGTLKYSAGALARGDRQRLVQVHSSSAAVFVVASVLAILATLVFVVVLPRAFPDALSGQQTVILVLGIAGTLDLLFHPQPASLRARSFYFIPDSVEVVTYLVFKLGLVIYLARTGLSLGMLCALTLAESLVRNLVNSTAGLWLCEWTRDVSLRAIDRVILRTLASYGGGTLLINLGELIRFQLSNAVIGFALAADQITVYSVGMRLIHVAYQSIGVIAAVSVPRFSGLHEQGDREGLLRLMRRSSLATGLVTAYVLANIGVLGLPFLKIWIRKPWVDEAFLVTQLMLPGYFVALLSHPSAMMLMGAGKLRGLSTLTLVEAGVNFALSVVLVRPLGIYGVCLATVLPMIAFRAIVFPLMLRAQIGVPVRTYYRSHLPAMGVALVYTLLLAPLRFVRVEGLAGFLLAGIGSTLVFAAIALAAFPEIRAAARARVLRREA